MRIRMLVNFMGYIEGAEVGPESIDYQSLFDMATTKAKWTPDGSQRARQVCEFIDEEQTQQIPSQTTTLADIGGPNGLKLEDTLSARAAKNDLMMKKFFKK